MALQDFTPAGHVFPGFFEKCAIIIPAQMLEQTTQSFLGITHQTALDRITQADALPVDIDLDRARLSRRRIELDIRKRTSDNQQGVAILERLLRRCRAEQPYAACAIGAAIIQSALAEKRLCDRSTELFRDLDQFSAGPQSTTPRQ